MQELAYRIRAAEPADAAALRAAIVSTLAHPDASGKRAGYKGAAERGELLLLERNVAKVWRIEAFAEYHLRLDDSLTIRDIGSAGDPPNAAAVKYLLRNLLQTSRAVGATVKVRQDATAWIEILEDIPGFAVEGREYRRPHYIVIWQWSP